MPDKILYKNLQPGSGESLRPVINPSKKSLPTPILIALGSVAFLSVLLLVFLGTQNSASDKSNKSAKAVPATNRLAPTLTDPGSVPKLDMSIIDNDLAFSVGPGNAKVVVVEFLDFECPYCKQGAFVIQDLLTKYEGESVRFVFRHLPLESIHSNAMISAHASMCAKDQGKFLQMHDLLYDRQSELSETNMYVFAQQINLNLSAFNTCMAKETYGPMIKKDILDAQTLGIRGTPTFFIGTSMIQGSADFDQFSSAIDSALQR